MRKLELIALAAATVVLATPAAAQGRGRGNDGVPPGQRPPAGMCRIWIDGVPPGQQPAPTSCALAEARRPANARVIYGDQTPFPGRGRGRHENVSDGRVITIDGRRCVERVDALGNATYDCPNTSRSSTGGVFGGILNGGRTRDAQGRVIDSQGRVIDSNGRVINRSGDDEDNDERFDRDNEDDNGGRGVGRGRGHKHGKHGRGDGGDDGDE